MPDQPGGERRGDEATEQQAQRPGGVDALRAEREQEAEAGGDGDEELAGVDRADDLARLDPAAGQDRGGADRAPAAAAGGVDEAGDQAERGEEPLAQRLAEVPRSARGR